MDSSPIMIILIEMIM